MTFCLISFGNGFRITHFSFLFVHVLLPKSTSTATATPLWSLRMYCHGREVNGIQVIIACGGNDFQAVLIICAAYIRQSVKLLLQEAKKPDFFAELPVAGTDLNLWVVSLRRTSEVNHVSRVAKKDQVWYNKSLMVKKTSSGSRNNIIGIAGSQRCRRSNIIGKADSLPIVKHHSIAF